MKLLTALVLVQSLLIAALFWKEMGPDDAGKTDQVALGEPVEQAVPRQAASKLQSPGRGDALSEQQVRRIIREELAAQLSLMQPVQAVGSAAEVEPVSPEEYQHRFEVAAQVLEYYIERGEISNSEMASLQADIAMLDQESRRHMLSAISRAINSGELIGNF